MSHSSEIKVAPPSLQQPIRLSIAAPAYNEAHRLYEIIVRWRDFLLQQKDIVEFEIVICNDGSSDETALILDYLHTQYPELRPFHLQKKQGASVALSHAIQATRFEWVFLTDADEQFPIENITRLLLATRRERTLAAIGIRPKRVSRVARLNSWLLSRLCNLLHGSHLKDFNSACKLVEGGTLRALILEAKGLNYATEITARLLERQIALAEVEIVHRECFAKKSKTQMLKEGAQRILFVSYLAFRQLLFKLNVLKPLS